MCMLADEVFYNLGDQPVRIKRVHAIVFDPLQALDIGRNVLLPLSILQNVVIKTEPLTETDFEKKVWGPSRNVEKTIIYGADVACENSEQGLCGESAVG